MVTMEPGKIVDAHTLKASDHVKALDPVLLVITALTACLGARTAIAAHSGQPAPEME